jgi:hypothetical protein
MNEHVAPPQSSKVPLALLGLSWACVIGAFVVWFIFKAPFESPRFVLGGAVPGAAIAAAGSLAAISSLAIAIRNRKAIAWPVVVLLVNAGYLLLFAVSLP